MTLHASVRALADRPVGRAALGTLTGLLAGLLVAGCGALAAVGGAAATGAGPSGSSAGASGSAAARRLLADSLRARRAITSGVVSLDLTVVPAGSATFGGPITLTVGGPFASRGRGRLPDSAVTVAVSAAGRRGAVQIASVDGRAYLTVAGQSYRVPASSLGTLGSGVGSGGHLGLGPRATGEGMLSALGLRPLAWLFGARTVGPATLDGVRTTHIRASLGVAMLLRDLDGLLGRAGSLGLSGVGALPHRLAAGPSRRIARGLRGARVDAWIADSDKLLRRLTVSATIPVGGRARAQLGGLHSVGVTLTLAYLHVNEPQTITAPASAEPFSVLRAQATALLAQLESGLLAGAPTGTGIPGPGTTPGATPGTSTTGAGTTATTAAAALAAASAAERRYARCIAAARGDVAKMLGCAALLGSR